MAMTIASRGGQRLGNLAPPSMARIGARARAFAAGQRHSRLVRLLRIVLPLAAGGILSGFLLYVAAKYTLEYGKFKPGTVTITTEDLQMKDPSFVDATSDGRYEVRAKRAVVAFTPNAPVKLIDVSGDLTQTSGTVTKLKAKHGLYERAKGELELFDGIEIDGSNGMMARLSRATVYSKQSKVVSEHPVSATTPTGSVQALAMTLETKARLAQFRGAVAVRLVQSTQAVGLGADARKPVDVRSETLDIDDAQKTAHFRGKVVALQGETMLQAPYLMIKYEGKASAALDSAAPKAPAGQQGTRVTFLWARNGVEITAGNDRRIASELADFDVAGDTALFVGKVVATQEKNVLKGERLFVDRKAGTSRLEPPDGGRIYATFYQSPGAQPQRPKRNPTAEAVQESAFGSFKSDPTAPMNVEANTLDIHETGGKAVFKGDVRAQQGDLLLLASELTAFYSGQGGFGLAGAAASSGAKEKGQVTRLEARNGVRIISNDGHSASGKWANLDVKANKALLGGGVFITKPGEDPTKPGAIKGDRLNIDLTTGISHVESEAQAILHPSKVPPTVTGPAVSSSSAASAPPTAAEKMEGCPPGRTCMLLYPKQVKDKALEVVKKKKAPAPDAP
jgi:lipopolysaccharide export system protein LptA